jgi:threonine aldolase
MYSFKNDYSEGAHQDILAALSKTNLEQHNGYGEDAFSLQAAELIKQKIGLDGLDVHFLTGGTQTNLTAISAFLRPHEAAISANTGHVLVHETGAIEATGHKVISVDSSNGKLTAEQVRAVVAGHGDEHMVKPRLVYLSQPTEVGTIYSRREMEQISNVCRELGLWLFVDGARLGSALCAAGNDLTLSILAGLVDAFYIGGTKNGALLGEALVIRADGLKADFRYHMKQKGALLAKGRLIGIQFLALFSGDLYFELARHANRLADQIRQELAQAGYRFLTDSPTNQLFPILPNRVIDELLKDYSFYIWEKVDAEHSAIRLVTSWATPSMAVEGFLTKLKELQPLSARSS